LKIVCFSHNAPPQNDPEAFCTARFLSALSAHGSDVHLITMVHPDAIEREVTEKLLDPWIRLTRLEREQSSAASRAAAIRNGVIGEEAAAFAKCVAAVREALARAGKGRAILLTRAYPAFSNMVGYACRREAAVWIAHFSDPFPGFGMYSRRNGWRAHVDHWWARRILSSADLVTVACRNALRWFSEKVCSDLAAKVHVVYPIGFPHLTDVAAAYTAASAECRFTHVGYWSERRYMRRVLEEFTAAASEVPGIFLHHLGATDVPGRSLLKAAAHSILAPGSDSIASPLAASRLLAESDVNMVIDQNDGLGYSPYLASKFAYAVAAGRPILAIGEADSEVALLCREHGGFYFADITRPGALQRSLVAVARTSPTLRARPSESLQRVFRPGTVAGAFLDRVDALMQEKQVLAPAVARGFDSRNIEERRLTP
jgi:hypothetical protein